jgi:putative ABC transport system ATP-binding protein
MAQIELRDIERTYLVGDQTVQALNHVSLEIQQGEYLSVMGPSGSGKSTLLNMIGLLDRPDSGIYSLNGTPTQDMAEEKRAIMRAENIGFIFQSFQLINRMTAQENIELPMTLTGVDRATRNQRAMQVMESLGISDRADHRPNQLSGGQMQRVGIARALVMEPKILLADEPTGNLDSVSGEEVTDLLEELNATGITLLVVTHDLDLGNRATRRIRMRDGKVVEDLVD